ncbi:MAG: hypothetical protein E6Q97_30090 [Desulfurellales bacterium]|nr:MAG: hypothetical protein E6Q97_30090 [Desulfurellales bacterium]
MPEYKTLTCNAIQSLGGRFIAVVQESIEKKPRTRHLLFVSDPPAVHQVYEGYDSKNKMQAEIVRLESEVVQKQQQEKLDAFSQLQAAASGEG